MKYRLPTVRPKHREVLKNMSNNVVTRQDAMLQEGYSEVYAKNGHIAETDSWQELMRTYLPDELLAKRHKELLNKRELVKIFNHTTGEYEKELYDSPDTQAVSKGLELGYRIKGKFPKEDSVNNTLIVIVPKAVSETFKIYGTKKNKENGI